MTHSNADLREAIQHMFASAWQDGVNHLNPKYLRRDTLFTDKVMELFRAREQQLLTELLGELPDEKVGTEKIPLNDIERGYNLAIQDAVSVIAKYREQLR